jgi:Ankyrin repeats (3 copies)
MDRVADFFAAVEAGDLATAQSLLASDADLARARDANGATALHVAAFHAHHPLMKLLLDAGADINARDHRFGATPSGWAAHYLRERGGFLAIEIDDLVYAIQTRNLEWIRRLIERHPQMIASSAADGRPVSAHARESGIPEIQNLFAAP